MLFLQKNGSLRKEAIKLTNGETKLSAFFSFSCIKINFFLQSSAQSAMITFDLNSLFIF